MTPTTVTPTTVKPTRSGSVIKIILIVLACAILIAMGVVYWGYRKVVTQAAAPLPIPSEAAPEVVTSVERRLKKLDAPDAAPSAASGASAAPASPSNLPITGDELAELLKRIMPPIPGLRLAIGISGGLADLKLSVPGKEVVKLVGNELGPLKSTVENNIQWVNVDAQVGIKLADGKMAISVKKVRSPDYIDAPKLQSLIDGMLGGGNTGPLTSGEGATKFEITAIELDGDAAIVNIRRAK